MSESLRNDGRVWVPKDPEDKRAPELIPEDARDYYLERRYPSFGNLVPRDVASRASKKECDEGRGVGETRLAVYLDFRHSIERLGEQTIRERYGNLFEMYQRITGDDPYHTPMRIYPAVHYTMGGLWVDYELQSTIPGLFVLGEANFSDHGANRLGASALMQGLADGYFVIPYTLGAYVAGLGSSDPIPLDDDSFDATEQEASDRIDRILKNKGDKSPTEFHRELGHLLWDHVGMSRTSSGLQSSLEAIHRLEDEFWERVCVPGSANRYNKNLEFAGRVADFIELGALMARDALRREESCGGHFREEYQTPEGEAARNDEDYADVAAWEYNGRDPKLHLEQLTFENVHPSQRSYK